MSKFELNLNEFGKVTGIGTHQYKAEQEQRLQAIIKVAVENYVPANVIPRARISPTIFSAELTIQQLKRLESDKHVASVSVSRKLRIVE
ncbi:hypothetical protein [Leisingera sp. M658]|uniref:hypothetical protein n=1 Tax=Leisingera sp. M658 TaxID=2867015 RepID=UPI0021A2EBAD|nr:hypothetical protein [Leisingera sp. M658]UWQ77069.1 hypothetical protein K3724_21525 [Leisingera sp. M658]